MQRSYPSSPLSDNCSSLALSSSPVRVCTAVSQVGGIDLTYRKSDGMLKITVLSQVLEQGKSSRRHLRREQTLILLTDRGGKPSSAQVANITNCVLYGERDSKQLFHEMLM